jgi:uncharacterized protein YlxP (DUF503 family)
VHSLKEKRSELKSLLARIRNKFNVSAAETDEQDTHQTLVIAVAAIAANHQQADSIMENIQRFVEESTDAEISDLKLYETQTTLIKTRHAQSVGLFVMNKAQYDALTDEQKGWLSQFVTQAEGDEKAAVAEDETSQEKTFVKKKMPVSEPTPEVLAALKSAVQTVIDAMKQNIDPAFVDAYIAACQQAEAQTQTAPAASVQPTDSQASALPHPTAS